MTTPVSFELAKLVKEKGFDVPVRNYYLVKDKLKLVYEGFDDDYWGDNRIVNWNHDVIGIKPFRGFISAPTIAEVVMWLYEKHGIWISVDSIDDSTIFRHCFSNIDFNLPTEAYEAAIEYTLNNLI